MSKKLRSYTEANAQYKPFWESFLSTVGSNRYTCKIVSPHGFEGSTVQENCVGFNDSELTGETVYIELVNFAKELTDPDYRTLYSFKTDKRFASMPLIYSAKVFPDTNTGATRVHWMVRVTDLTEVNKTHNSYPSAVFAQANAPVSMTAGAESANMAMGSGSASSIPAARFGFNSEPEMPKAMQQNYNGAVVPPSLPPVETESLEQDDHLSKMTMRDKIAIEWKRPVSFKPWLNELINLENQRTQ